MWWTNSLCILANEDLGTLAEYDPLTQCSSRLGTCVNHWYGTYAATFLT